MSQVDYFLKLDGVEGECKDDKHKNEIEVESWSWGETNSGSSSHGTGMGAGKVSMQDFHFVMKVCKASPKLMENCATGKHIPKGDLVCRKAGGNKQEEYLIIKFTDLLVSSYQTGGSAGDVIPMDQISLNFSSIVVEYKPQSEKGSTTGSVKGGWDLKVNKVKS